jgi:hypothetical protein
LVTLLSEALAELRTRAALDAEARGAADAVAAEFRRLGVERGHAQSTASRLDALAVRFEADHPAAAAALRQLADQLGKAGI